MRDVIEHVLKKRPRRGKEKIVVLRKVKRKSFALSIAYPGKLSYFTRKKGPTLRPYYNTFGFQFINGLEIDHQFYSGH